MGYVATSFVFGEQPSAAKWNQLGSNDSSFNDGTGIGNGVIKASHLGLGGDVAAVATAETTSGTSYTDLATTTDTVTVTVGANGLLQVSIGAQLNNNTLNNPAQMAFALSGANTLAAADQYSIFMTPYANNAGDKKGETFLLKGLTPGSTTAKLKYKSGIGGTSQFTYRRIAAIPL